MAHPARVSLRAPPHLPFIQGFPGIPGGPSRRPAGVHGTVEVRVGAVPIKAKWVRVEIRKHEVIPPGFKVSSSEEKSTWEHVGEIQTLWQSTNPNKEFEVLETADFKFFLPLPENLPPSVTMMKESGIRYELVAAVCYKQKGGMFKKDAASVTKAVEDLRITKHELNAAWPIYNEPETFSATGAKGQVTLTVQRPCSAFGPNDRVLMTAVLRSDMPSPFRVKGFECTLLEVVTITQGASGQDKDKKKSKKSAPPMTKSRTVATARYPIDEKVGRGGEKSARIDILMAPDKLLATVRNGRSIEIGYEMEVKAVCEGMPELVVKGMKYIVGPFSRAHSQQAVRDIGHFPPLCPAPSGPQSSNPPSTRPGSPTSSVPFMSPPLQSPSHSLGPTTAPVRNQALGQPDFPPGFSGHPLSRPPVQGFEPALVDRDNRRKSSSTITTTTTTHEFGAPQISMTTSGSRGYGTMPNRFSMPAPAPYQYQNGNLLRTPSYGSSVDKAPSPQLESFGEMYTQDMGEGSGAGKRYSTMTTGTFGMRDRDPLESLAEHEYANTSAPSSTGARPPTRGGGSGFNDPNRAPPSSWLPAEQEKQRLYNEARARAANTQMQTGASMQDIGMDAPPDYDTPSRHTQVSSTASSPIIPPPAIVLTAAEEQEQQRKRYEEAQAKANAGSPSQQSGGAGGSDSARQPTYLTAGEEKEIQKKRYNDALARGGGSQLADSNGPRPPSQNGGMPWATLTAAEEKELQRKRYEEATGRVGVASDAGSMSSRAASPFLNTNGGASPALGEGPIPYDAIYSASNSGVPPLNPSLQKDGRSSRIVSNPTASVPSSPLASGSTRRPMSMTAGPASSTNATRGLALSGNQGRGDRSLPAPIPQAQDGGPVLAIGSGRPMSAAPPLDEKAQMKRYYEALDRVNNSAAGGSGSGDTSYADQSPPINAPSSSSRTPANVSKPAAFPSAAEEKEQMRKRFEEAQSRVNQTQGTAAPASTSNPSDRQGAGASSSSSANARLPPPSQQYMSAEQEKEQMRKRYEAATSAVGSPKIDHSPSSPRVASGSGSAQQQLPKPYLSAAEEKEQMRKRFEEATAAVNRQSSGSAPTPTIDGPSNAGGGSGSGTGSGSAPPPPAFMSAAEEKEQMRERFESATAAVNRQSSGPPPAIDRASNAGSGSGFGSGTAPAPPAFMSAAEEKEQMRKRFESATAAVNRQSSGPPPAIDGSKNAGSGSGSGSGSAPAAAFMSAAEEKEQMRKRFESAQAAVNPPQARTVPGRAPSIPIDPNAPPPPLPTRPPVEYITLLSPVGETERPPWTRGPSFGMPGQGGQAQGSASGSGSAGGEGASSRK